MEMLLFGFDSSRAALTLAFVQKGPHTAAPHTFSYLAVFLVQNFLLKKNFPEKRG